MQTLEELFVYKCDVCGCKRTIPKKLVLSKNVRVLLRITAHDGVGTCIKHLDVCRDCVNHHPDQVLCSLISRDQRDRHISLAAEPDVSSEEKEELEELRDELERAHAALDALRERVQKCSRNGYKEVERI